MAEWKASGISDALTKSLARFTDCSINSIFNIDPFYQGEVDFNITVVVDCASED